MPKTHRIDIGEYVLPDGARISGEGKGFRLISADGENWGYFDRKMYAVDEWEARVRRRKALRAP